MSLFRIHGLSHFPSHFLNDTHVLIQSGTILSFLNLENGEQTFILQLQEFDSISCIASNPAHRIFAIAIQSGTESRMEIYSFRELNDINLLRTFTDCSNVGYSHIDISADGQYMIAISNIPSLEIEFWSIAKQKKVATANLGTDHVKFVSFSPSSYELFVTATSNAIILWRVYYKFDQYFLTSTVHSLKNARQITSITFGEGGKEVVYCNNENELIVFDENSASNDFSKQIKHKFTVSQPILKFFFTRFYYILVLEQPGVIQFISKQSLQLIYESSLACCVKHCAFNPNYRQILLVDEQHKLINYSIDKKLLLNEHQQLVEEADLTQQHHIIQFSQITANIGYNLVSLQNEDSILLNAKELQLVPLPMDNSEKQQYVHFPISNVSTTEICHYSQAIDLIAIGFKDGHVGLAYMDHNSEPTSLKLFFAERLFACNVKQIQFDKTGTFVACISEKDAKIWFAKMIPNEAPKVLGYYKLNHIPICCCWLSDAYGNSKIIVSFQNGLVSTYDAPQDANSSGIHGAEHEFEDDEEDNERLLLLDAFYVDCEVDFSLTKILCDPNQTAPDRLICLSEDNKLKAFLLDDDATIFPDDMFLFDDHMKSVTDIRIHGDLLLTAGTDGLINIRYLSDPTEVILSIYAHNSSIRGNGVLSAQFVYSGCKILSVGYDGSVISWELEEDVIFENQLQDIDLECPFSVSFLNELSAIEIDAEAAALTYEEKLKTNKIDQQKQELEPHLVEIKNELDALRKTYNEITEKVRNASELEKLDEKELIVDTAEYDALTQQNQEETNKVAQEIKYGDIGKQLIMRRIKGQCWDSMKEKLQIVRGIKSDEQVTTFPILAQQHSDIQLTKKLQFLRKMNIMEQDWSSRTQDRVAREFDVKQPVSHKGIKYIWDIHESSKEDLEQQAEAQKTGNTDKANDGKDADKKQKKEDNKKDKNNNDGGDEYERVRFPISRQLQSLLYHPMKLYTKYSKHVQINLLNLRMREVKSAFNKEVIKIHKLKTREVERINEMALEITDIQKELQLTDAVFTARMEPIEDKESIFRVNDSEIGVEKVLTEKELVELKRKEEEREKRENDTNRETVERALVEMMNNTLESKDEVERLEDTLKRPDFMDIIDEAQWSDAQKAEVSQYEEKKQALLKAKEVRTKLLQTRLKSLKNDVAEIVKNFDSALQALYNVRLAVLEDIYVHELMLIHLANDIVEYEQYEKHIESMQMELRRLSEDKEKADNTYNQFHAKLEEAKKKLEDLQAADKYLERTFKKEMSGVSGDYFDYLFKLFRGKHAVPPKHGFNTHTNTRLSSVGFDRRMSTHSITSVDSNSDAMSASIKRSHSRMSMKRKASSKISLTQSNHHNDDESTENLQMAGKPDDRSELLLLNDLKEDAFEPDEDDEFYEQRRKEEAILNPYFDMNEDLKSNDVALAELRNLPKPVDMSFQIWTKFIELRKLKILKDKEIANVSQQIASMQDEVNALKSNQRIIQESIEEIENGKQVFLARRQKYKLDTELFFCCAQGQVEVQEAPVVTDMRQSVLVDRAVIEALNNIILDAGKEQIERLNEIKKFRRGINLLNWRAKVLDLEYRYYTLLTTEYQLRRVTKKDQEILKAGGHDSKQKNEVASLEKKLEFTMMTMDAKIKEKKKQFKKYKDQMMEINKSNDALTSDIEQVQSDVLSKKEIVNIRGSVSLTEEKKQSVEKQMDAVVTRRKLVDLVAAQSDEIQFLRTELDRLRKKTFPSFSIAES